MAKGKRSGNLMNPPSENGGTARQRRDYTVHVLTKDGTRRDIDCGTSVKCKDMVLLVLELYGAPQVAKFGHSSKPHEGVVKATNELSEDDLAEWES